MYLLKRRQWTSTQTISANIPPCLHVLNWYKSDFSARLKLRGVSFSRVFRFHVFAPWNFISLSPKNLWHSARLKLPFEAGRVFRMGIAKRSTGRGELLLFVLFLETSILLSRNIGTEKKNAFWWQNIICWFTLAYDYQQSLLKSFKRFCRTIVCDTPWFHRVIYVTVAQWKVMYEVLLEEIISDLLLEYNTHSAATAYIVIAPEVL